MKNATFPVTSEPGIDIAVATAAKPYTDWLESMDEQRFKVRGVHLQSVDMFGQNPPRVGFIKFKADVTDADGKFVPGIVFMRGGAVAMLPILRCEGVEYTVVTVQPRVPTGKFDFVEIPAGMLDGSGNFAGVAAKELDQELELKIDPKELFDLTAFAGYQGGFFLSPGGSDETIRLFTFSRDVSAEELAAWNGKCTGVLEEGEQITLKIVRVADLWKIPDAKTVVASILYTAYKQSQGS